MTLSEVTTFRKEGVESIKLGIPRRIQQDSQFPYEVNEKVMVQIAQSNGEPCLIIRKMTKQRARDAGEQSFDKLNFQAVLINRKREIDIADKNRTRQQHV